MTRTQTDRAPPVAALAPDVDALDQRSRRAWIESMAVRPLPDGRFAVDGESGATYVVDLRHGDCSCPDHEIRGALCKHLRRVALEITHGRVPPPDRPRRCRACGRPMAEDGPGDDAGLCEDCGLAPGDVVIDREGDPDTPLLVVSVSPRRADAVEIPEAERTVAEYGANRGYDPGDPVVEVVYPGSVRKGREPRRFSFPRGRLATPGDDDHEQTTLPAWSTDD